LNERGFTGAKPMNKKRCPVIMVIVAAAMLLLAPSCTTPNNRPPIIASLEAEPEKVITLGSCQIVCNATDPDSDELSYRWSASGGGIIGEGATVTWTAPISAGSYNVTVTATDGRGGEITDYVTITARANSPPTITSLAANAAWATPSGSLQVTCNASDPDNDELSYEWTATGGNISGTGAVVNWTAPQEVGIYNATVVVKDGYGGQDTRFVPLIVAFTPPSIENLIVTAQEPKYLKASNTTGCDYDVWKTEVYYIECIASNTSGELVYDWSCDGGEISGRGSNITWTAPNKTSVKATVTVIVSDAAGNRVDKNIVFHIPSCSCDFG